VIAKLGASEDTVNKLWDMESLSQAPQVYEAPDYGAKSLKSIFLEGEPYRGKTTRVFAYYSLPPGADLQHPVPGIVCVHGGGGTAFAEWVQLWNHHGFAAIAMDTNGSVPESIQESPDAHHHAWVGPQRYSFDLRDKPLKEHWNYHAIAAVIRANSFLRTLDGVDADNIGITGISWGGYKTCIAVGVDSRFKFAISVYGCGFLSQGSTWTQAINDYGAKRWTRYWDPSSYLPRAKLPMLWVNGTNDPHYHLPIFQKSAQALGGHSQLLIQLEMDHGHGSGWEPPEIYAFAKSKVGLADPMVTVGRPSHQKKMAWVRYEDSGRQQVVSAELLATSDEGAWHDRQWQKFPAQVKQGKVNAKLPPRTTAYFFNLTDQRGLVVSSEYVVTSPDVKATP